MERERRDALLLAAAVTIADEVGLYNLTHQAVADRANCSKRTVERWAGTHRELRDKVCQWNRKLLDYSA